ncbi:histamine H2 receptor-like [Pocillopora damicornis]|uniref:histamine H2 receptor-like n=1 Tax=Pocillopora damicornis TaxID=46731 RepID=UPI000F54EC12|nr:histamine H2 receptor-like [Pocillopora damicornis]
MANSNSNNTSVNESFDNSSVPKLSNVLLVSYIGNCVLNVFLSFTATFGNIVIAISLRKISSLHAPSKALYFGLALSDLGVGVIGHPLYLGYLLTEMSSNGQSKQDGVIHATHNILSVLLCAISLLTMTAISMDRLLALRLKFRYRETVTLRRVTMALIFSYILSATMSTAYLWNYPLYLGATYGGIFVCALMSSVCCILVYVSIRKQRTRQVFHYTASRLPSCILKRNADDSSFNMLTYRKSFVSALYVYASLCVCYLPYVCLKIIGRFSGWNDDVSAAFYWCGTLVLFKSSLNPLLYCWRIQGIRQAAKETVRRLIFCFK